MKRLRGLLSSQGTAWLPLLYWILLGSCLGQAHAPRTPSRSTFPLFALQPALILAVLDSRWAGVAGMEDTHAAHQRTSCARAFHIVEFRLSCPRGTSEANSIDLRT